MPVVSFVAQTYKSIPERVESWSSAQDHLIDSYLLDVHVGVTSVKFCVSYGGTSYSKVLMVRK